MKMTVLTRSAIIVAVGVLLTAGVVMGFQFQKNDHPYYAEFQRQHEKMMREMTHDTMAGDMQMNEEQNQKLVAVLLYDDFTLMDAAGPMQSLSTLPDFKVVTVAKKQGEITSESGTKIIADYSFENLPKNVHTLVVPGGLMGTMTASEDPATLAWIRTMDKETVYTTSVCTGSWILAAAGVLEGKNASTHWSGKEHLEKLGAKYSGKRYTVDGKYVTSAGVSAGIDMGLFLTGVIKGDDAAKIAQLTMEYDPQPPYNSGSPDKADRELVKMMQAMYKDHTGAMGN